MDVKETNLQDLYVRKAIRGSAEFYQMSIEEQWRRLGMARATWYRRMKNPGDFTVDNLRQMIKMFHWDAETVGKMLGLK